MSNSSSSVESTIATLRSVSSIINTYSFYITTGIGLPFNLLSIFIFTRPNLNKTNMGFLYGFKSAVDFNLIFTSIFVFRGNAYFGFSMSTTSDFLCKLSTFLRRMLFHTSSMMCIVTTLDRFLFNIYPNRFSFVKKKLGMSIIIVAIFFTIGLANIPNLMFYLVVTNTTRSCTATNDVTISSDIISIFLRTFIPFGVMFTLNLIMLRKILKQRSSLTQTAISRKEHQFTIMVISFDLIFFFSNLPLALYYIFYNINLYLGTFTNNTLFRTQYTLVISATLALSFFDQTFAFFLNFALNKLFRQEILKLLSRLKPFRSIAIDQTLQTNSLQHSITNSMKRKNTMTMAKVER
jgi:hypothetical protein